MNIKVETVELTAPSGGPAPAPYHLPITEAIMQVVHVGGVNMVGDLSPDAPPKTTHNTRLPVTVMGYDSYWGARPFKTVPEGEVQHLRGIRITISAMAEAAFMKRLVNCNAFYDYVSYVTALTKGMKSIKKLKCSKGERKERTLHLSQEYKFNLRHLMGRDTNRPTPNVMERPVLSRFLNGGGLNPECLRGRMNEPWMAAEIECFLPHTRDGIVEEFQKLMMWGVGVKGDGSLHNGPSGFSSHELVYCRPRQGYEIGLAKLCAWLKENRVSINSTCGLHVHMDMRKHDQRAVEAIAQNIEQHMDMVAMVIKPDRSNVSELGRFCRPGLDWDDRYRRVNLAAYRRHKTLEIRFHHGEAGYDAIVNWFHLMEVLQTHKPPSPGQTFLKWLENLPVSDAERGFWRDRAHKFWPSALDPDREMGIPLRDSETSYVADTMTINEAQTPTTRALLDRYPHRFGGSPFIHLASTREAALECMVRVANTHEELTMFMQQLNCHRLQCSQYNAWSRLHQSPGVVRLEFNGRMNSFVTRSEAFEFICEHARNNTQRNGLLDQAHIGSLTGEELNRWSEAERRRLESARIAAMERAARESIENLTPGPDPQPDVFEPRMPSPSDLLGVTAPMDRRDAVNPYLTGVFERQHSEIRRRVADSMDRLVDYDMHPQVTSNIQPITPGTLDNHVTIVRPPPSRPHPPRVIPPPDDGDF